MKCFSIALTYILLMVLMVACTNTGDDSAKTETKTSAKVTKQQTTSTTTDDEKETVGENKMPPIKAVSIKWIDGLCVGLDKEDTGCSCSFRAEKDNYKSSVFEADMEGNACINLGGAAKEMLTGKQIDRRMDYYKQSFDKVWISLNEQGEDLIFGQKLNMGDNYEEHRVELVKTLLVMDEIPQEIPIAMNGTVGMGYRSEVRSMCSEALQMAKAAKAKGDTGPAMEMLYTNDNYEVHIKGKVIGKTDSGSDRYNGTMKVKDKNGNILATSPVWGACQC